MHTSQSVHALTFELIEYLPATHATQVVALAAEPVLVIEPAAHSEQYDWPPFAWYLPGSHAVQLASFFVAEY